MNQWIEHMIDALAEPQESLTILAQLIIILSLSIGAATRRVGHRLLLIRQFKPQHAFMQALSSIAGLQALHVWFAMTGYPHWLADTYPALVIIAGCAAAATALLWITYGIRRRKAHHFVSGFCHTALLMPLHLILGYEYSLHLQSGTARTIDYLISWPAVAACLILLSQLTYSSRGVYVRSIGRFDGRGLPASELKLLFTLRPDQQVLQDRAEPAVYYLHDLANDQFFQYNIADEPGRSHTRKVRRNPPKLMPVETATTVEIPPRRQRRR